MSEKVPTAKVYVWKERKPENEELPWRVGVLGWGDILIVHHEAATQSEAWVWLYENYKRETP